jgi:hypothetical protein
MVILPLSCICLIHGLMPLSTGVQHLSELILNLKITCTLSLQRTDGLTLLRKALALSFVNHRKYNSYILAECILYNWMNLAYIYIYICRKLRV